MHATHWPAWGPVTAQYGVWPPQTVEQGATLSTIVHVPVTLVAVLRKFTTTERLVPRSLVPGVHLKLVA